MARRVLFVFDFEQLARRVFLVTRIYANRPKFELSRQSLPPVPYGIYPALKPPRMEHELW